eukprot:SAG11_NODE_25330_length_360_cov_0.796935_2_plen_34_part_01
MPRLERVVTAAADPAARGHDASLPRLRYMLYVGY